MSLTDKLAREEISRILARAPIFSRGGGRDGKDGQPGPTSGLINLKTEGAVGGNAAQDTAALNSAIAKATALNCGIDIPFSGGAAYALNANVTVPANVPLVFARGAQVAPAVGTVLTINATISAAASRIFSGAGTVQLLAGGDCFPEWWGITADGLTDNTAALIAAMVATPNGACFNYTNYKASYRFDGRVAVPNDGAATPRQASWRFTSPGAPTTAGQSQAPFGGVTLDMRWNGATAAIDTRGLGTLEIDHLTFIDSLGSSTPFIQTTNTTLKVHHNRADGVQSKIHAACDKDFLVLGGTVSVIDGTANGAFQGYGTTIADNCVNALRRLVYGRVFCNAIVVRDNWALHLCGSNLVGGACIEFAGDATDACTGNLVTGNQIECGYYPYPIKETYGANNQYTFNSFFDKTAAVLAYHRFESAASYAIVIPGYCVDTVPAVSAVAGANVTEINAHQSQVSKFPGGLSAQNLALAVLGPTITSAAGDTWGESTGPLGGFKAWFLNTTPVGGANETIASWIWRGIGDISLRLWGATANRIEALSALKLLSAAGTELWLGDATAQKWYVLNGKLIYTGAAGTPAFSMGPLTPALAAAATDPATTMALANSIRTALINLGLTS